MRLFVSIGLSPEVKTQLLSAMDVLREQGCGQFTPPENLHLTIAFLGETKQLDAAKEAISAVSAAAFSITVEGVGAFGDLLWAGVSPSAELHALQKDVTNKLKAAGFSPEDREFIPHITLVRRFTPSNGLNLALVTEALGSSSCRVAEILLIESCHQDGRHRYYPQYTKVLEGK